ncbi:unnamed protein product [Notodromas monacha]|uniref:Heat shock factor-binding protein 1 n=1 Tax=Notodromas monacha TaxID=399045 RepID=A0A7R9BIN6_9CRUS|nr:unnamed protein product [Notodromas monacha]CAG0915925.1 unnamed protein product [Notodromas monacha]
MEEVNAKPETKTESEVVSKSVSDPSTTEELLEFVQGQLGDMQKRLQDMTDVILGRIDSLGTRINDLERNMNDLIEAAEVDPDPKSGSDAKRFDLES